MRRIIHVALMALAPVLVVGGLAVASQHNVFRYIPMFDGGTITQPLVAPSVTAATFTATAGGGIYSDTFGSTSGAGIEVRDSLTLPATGSITYAGRATISSPSPGVLLYSIPGTELGLRLAANLGTGAIEYLNYDGSTLLPISASGVATATASVGDALVRIASPTGDELALTDSSSTSPIPLVLGPHDGSDSIRLTAASGQLTIDRPGSASPANIDLGSGVVRAGSFVAAGSGGYVYAPRIASANGDNATALLVPPSVVATFDPDPGDLTQTVSLIPAQSLVLGVSGYVSTPATGCELVNVGDATDEDRYAALFDVSADAATTEFGPHDYAPDLHWRAESMPGDVVVTGYAADGTTPAACIDLQLRLSAHAIQFNNF